MSMLILLHVYTVWNLESCVIENKTSRKSNVVAKYDSFFIMMYVI